MTTRIRSILLAAASPALLVSLQSADAAAVGYVPYAGGSYTQDFNTLAYTSGTAVNTANPLTITNSELQTPASVVYTLPNSTATATPTTYSLSDTTLGSGSNSLATASGGDPGMDGWWGTAAVGGGSNTTVKNLFGAQDGSQTTGGLVSFGTLTTNASNRALGLLSTSTSGYTTMGVAIENTGSTTYSTFSLSYTGELWRQQTSQKYLHFGYQITGTNVSSNTNGGGALPTSGATGDSNLDVVFATGTSTGSTSNNTGPLMTSSLSDTIGGISWAPSTTLWLTWQTWDPTAGGTSASPGASAIGSSQGVAIDNLSFSASVPEPTSVGLFAIVGGGLLMRRRKRIA